jgi:FMN-dependent NADH-azoreductase
MTHSMRILRIDSSAKTETSESRRLTDRIIEGLKTNGKSPDVTVRDLNESLPQVDTAWIEANNTASDDHTDEHKKTLALSNMLVDFLLNNQISIRPTHCC